MTLNLQITGSEDQLRKFISGGLYYADATSNFRDRTEMALLSALASTAITIDLTTMPTGRPNYAPVPAPASLTPTP